jgi:hypothetical protein
MGMNQAMFLRYAQDDSFGCKQERWLLRFGCGRQTEGLSHWLLVFEGV